MDYQRFSIGDTVIARNTMTVRTNGETRYITKRMIPANGAIVGLKRFFIGKYKRTQSGCSLSGYEEEGRTAYIDITGSVVVWAIKEGLFNRPVYAHDEDVVAGGRSSLLPLLHQRQCSWTDQDKAVLRDIMKDAPRDGAGRWIKENK